jgi:hypothetical protein
MDDVNHIGDLFPGCVKHVIDELQGDLSLINVKRTTESMQVKELTFGTKVFATDNGTIFKLKRDAASVINCMKMHNVSEHIALEVFAKKHGKRRKFMHTYEIGGLGSILNSIALPEIPAELQARVQSEAIKQEVKPETEEDSTGQVVYDDKYYDQDDFEEKKEDDDKEEEEEKDEEEGEEQHNNEVVVEEEWDESEEEYEYSTDEENEEEEDDEVVEEEWDESEEEYEYSTDEENEEEEDDEEEDHEEFDEVLACRRHLPPRNAAPPPGLFFDPSSSDDEHHRSLGESDSVSEWAAETTTAASSPGSGSYSDDYLDC